MTQQLFKILFVLISTNFFSQSTNKIDSLRKFGKIQDAIIEYQDLISSNGVSKKIANDYAEVLSLNKDIDKAFHYLEISVESDSTANSLKNPLFYNLIRDKKWNVLTKKQLIKYQAKEGEFKNYDFAKKLFELQQKDQLYYYEINVSDRLTGRKSLVTSALWKLKDKTNEELLVELEQLIGENGYPKCSDKMPCSAAFLIFQHANLQTQEKYVGRIKELCEKRDIPCAHYAMIQDRINLRRNLPQIYGTQLTYNKDGKLVLYDIIEPEKVNERRLKLGLNSIESK